MTKRKASSNKASRRPVAKAAQDVRRTPQPPYDYNTAVLYDMWGWWWASIAADEGVLAAATYPLPESEEAEVRRIALSHKTCSPAARAYAQRIADGRARQAVEAYLASVPLVQRADKAKTARRRLWREAEGAALAAERLGRAAAVSQRALMLLYREVEGVH